MTISLLDFGPGRLTKKQLPKNSVARHQHNVRHARRYFFDADASSKLGYASKDNRIPILESADFAVPPSELFYVQTEFAHFWQGANTHIVLDTSESFPQSAYLFRDLGDGCMEIRELMGDVDKGEVAYAPWVHRVGYGIKPWRPSGAYGLLNEDWQTPLAKDYASYDGTTAHAHLARLWSGLPVEQCSEDMGKHFGMRFATALSFYWTKDEIKDNPSALFNFMEEAAGGLANALQALLAMNARSSKITYVDVPAGRKLIRGKAKAYMKSTQVKVDLAPREINRMMQKGPSGWKTPAAQRAWVLQAHRREEARLYP